MDTFIVNNIWRLQLLYFHSFNECHKLYVCFGKVKKLIELNYYTKNVRNVGCWIRFVSVQNKNYFHCCKSATKSLRLRVKNVPVLKLVFNNRRLNCCSLNVKIKSLNEGSTFCTLLNWLNCNQNIVVSKR